MNSIIIFPNDNGGVAFVFPCDCGLTVEEIARKDVPSGKPYLIVPKQEMPTDSVFLDACEADFSNPHGFGIGHEAWFAEQADKEQA